MRNHKVPLIIAVLWALCAVLSKNIFARATEMSLAVSSLSNYLELQFRATPTQKTWIQRFKYGSPVTAGIFLIVQFYCLFVA